MELLRTLFFIFIVRPLVLVGLGLNVRHRERLPVGGPAVIAANHNSHLDTLVLMSLFSLRRLPAVRPVAAADYFCRGGFREWFARRVIKIIPLERAIRTGGEDPLSAIERSLADGEVVILFPEGSRGEPEKLSAFKSGVAHLARRHPTVPVVPVFLHGLGKSLPRGEGLLVPFFCDVFIGEALFGTENKNEFMSLLETRMHALGAEGQFTPWE